MASITARGCYKVAQASKTEISPDTGAEVRTVIALRSDAKVLRAIHIRPLGYAEYGSRGWSRSGYTIIGTLKAEGGIGPLGNGKGQTSLDRFLRFSEQRGFTRDDVRCGR